MYKVDELHGQRSSSAAFPSEAKENGRIVYDISSLKLSHREAEVFNVILGKNQPDAFITQQQLITKNAAPPACIDTLLHVKPYVPLLYPLISAPSKIEANPFGVAFTEYTLPRSAIALNDTALTSQLKSLSSLRIKSNEKNTGYMNDIGMPSSHNGMDLPGLQVRAHADDTSVHIRIQGKHETFPIAAISDAVNVSEQRSLTR